MHIPILWIKTFTDSVVYVSIPESCRFLKHSSYTYSSYNYKYIRFCDYFSLSFAEEPIVRQEQEEVIVKKEDNTNVEFKCFATGYPRPTIHWDHHLYSDSSEVSVNDNTNDDTVVSTLTLYNAHPEDSGTVGCYAIVEPGGNTAPLHSEMAVAKLSVLSKLLQLC